jgi:hypothetical protein
MFLKFADNKLPSGVAQYNYVVGPGNTQQVISIILLIIALVTPPIMLYAKPCILKRRLKNADHVEVHSEKIQLHQTENSARMSSRGVNNENYEQIKDFLEKEGSGNDHHSAGGTLLNKSLFYRYPHPSDYRNHRIRLGHSFQYCFLPSSMGPISRPLSACRCVHGTHPCQIRYGLPRRECSSQRHSGNYPLLSQFL